MKQLFCYQLYNVIVINVPRNKISWCCKQTGGSDLKNFDPFNLENDPILKDIRGSLKKGIKHSACNLCWESEKRNIKSWRQLEGIIPDNLKDKDLDSEPYNKKFKRIEISFDNTCDLSCMYCFPSSSSKWFQENLQTKLFSENIEIFKTDSNTALKIKNIIKTIGKNSDKSDEIYITFVGGEPFLSPQLKNGKFKEFIDAFYETADHSTVLIINFITNCNTPDEIFDKNLNILKESKKLYPNLKIQISISLESIKELTEISRFGSSWKQIDKNIKKWVSEESIEFNFNTAFNAITIHDVENYVDYLIKLSIDYKRLINVSANIVYYPVGLNPTIMPKSYSCYLENSIKKILDNKNCFLDDEFHGWQGFVKILTDIKNNLGTNSDKKDKLRFYIEYFEKVRNINFKKITPELYNYVYS